MSFCLLIEKAMKEERADNGHVFRRCVCLIQLAFISKHISYNDIKNENAWSETCVAFHV